MFEYADEISELFINVNLDRPKANIELTTTEESSDWDDTESAENSVSSVSSRESEKLSEKKIRIVSSSKLSDNSSEKKVSIKEIVKKLS